MKSNFSLEVSNTQYINKTKKSNTSGEKNMLIKIMDILAGLKMTIVSGIFLLCAVMCMVSGIESPIDPAWGAVIISGIPLFYLALYRLIFEKWVSSALLITIAMVASLVIGEIFAAAEVAWIMALGALLEDGTVERAKKGLKNLIELTPQTGRLICNENGKKTGKNNFS
jgi:cation transport ATPase